MLSVFLLAAPLATVWMVLSNQLTWQGFILGYLVGFLVLWLGGAQKLEIKVAKIPSMIFWLAVYGVRLIIDIFLSSVGVVRIVLSPGEMPINLGIIPISTQDETNNDIVAAMSAHGITITPGQMVVDFGVEDGQTIMYIHNLDVEESRDQLVPDQQKRLQLIRRGLGYD